MWLFLALAVFAQSISAQLVAPANVFTGCKTALPGGMSVLPGTFSDAQSCNTACYRAYPTLPHSFFQPSTGSCQCTSRYPSPTENDSGNAGNCRLNTDWDTRLTSTSFHLVGCYTNRPAGLVGTAKTGPSGCTKSCASGLQAGFLITSVSRSLRSMLSIGSNELSMLLRLGRLYWRHYLWSRHVFRSSPPPKMLKHVLTSGIPAQSQ